MVFRKIPRKFDYKGIIEQIKARVLYSDDIDSSAVISSVADQMGIDKKTVYDYLDGRINLNLDFLHALVIASGGDSILKGYLEPEGYRLSSIIFSAPDKRTLPEEILDNHPEIIKFEQLLMENLTGQKANQLARIERQFSRVTDEFRQDIESWRLTHGA